MFAAFLAANSQVIIAAITAIGAYLYHRVSSSSAERSRVIVSSALASIVAIFDAFVTTAPTSKGIAALRIELRGLAAVQMGKRGIYEGTPERAALDLAVGVAIEVAIARFVTAHPAVGLADVAGMASLHAEIVA